jgi:hypothetical protein
MAATATPTPPRLTREAFEALKRDLNFHEKLQNKGLLMNKPVSVGDLARLNRKLYVMFCELGAINPR